MSYEHDHLGRKISYIYNEKLIAKYFYDAIGRLQIKNFSPSGTTQGSKQTGNWTDVSNWLSGTLPTLADNVTINTGQILTIPSGEKAFAGILNDKGTLRNFGTLNMGKYTPTDLYNQSMNYHIRGGLRGINLDASGNLTNTLFSYKLEYEDDGVYFDGNIRKQTWRSNLDNVTRSNTFRYDGSSQIKASVFASTKTGENYSLNNVNYDGNGNILALSRSGATNANYTAFGNVDNLSYTYQGNSNKLLKIADATTTNTDLGDFRDGTNTGDDYEYWADGSLKKDRNKKIASITYNYLKRPETITFDDGRTITTEYDAEGTKLKKIDSNGEVTDYEEDDIYMNNVLYQTSHDEGRIANGVFEYNITDHNNDLRVAFRDSSGIAVPTQSIFYDPWGLSMKGMQITRNPTNFNKYQFLNRETQFETGYIDLINRQFDPQRGQFTSQDPVIEGQEHLSLYQYGWNNPVLKSDPNGDCPFCPAIPFLPEIGAGLVAAGEALATTAVGVAIGVAVDKLAHSGVSMNHSGMGYIPGIDYSGNMPTPIMKSSPMNNAQSKSNSSSTTEKGKNEGTFGAGKDTQSNGSSNASLRSAKEQNGIPKSQQPDKTIKPNTPEGDKEKLDSRNVKQYEYTNSKGEKISIREDKPATYGDGGKGDQGKHHNAGKTDEKLTQHHNNQ